jgi:hypothetical protein
MKLIAWSLIAALLAHAVYGLEWAWLWRVACRARNKVMQELS